MTESGAGYKLETRHLTKQFVKRGGERVEVLRDINIGISGGEFVSIVGASGCGKTTLLRILDCLIPPSGGEILIDGRPVVAPGPDRAFVFQADSLFPWRTVRDNVLFGLQVQGGPRQQSLAVAGDLMQLVGLDGFESHYPHEISGGMRQRVNLARALAVNPAVLLMDEPFASLDAQTREVMQSELLRIWAAHRKTVVFITHQIDEAVYLSDRVIIFTARPGRVKHILEIDIPRPRPLSIKRTPQFLSYVDCIWGAIEEEVMQAMGMRRGR